MKQREFDRKERYGIRKFTVGAASVVIGAVVFGVSPVLAQEAPTTNGETAGQALPELPKEVETGNLANLDKELADKLATSTDKGTEVNREELRANPGSEKSTETTATTGATTTTETPAETPAAETDKTEETEKQEAIARDYYSRELENVNTVVEKNDLVINAANNQRDDLTSDLEKLKKLQDATVHMEFKPDASAPRFYNLFSVSSDTKENEYYTMSVFDNTALIEGRDANGAQFYDKYTDAPLKVRPGQWNSVTFTVEKPTTEVPTGRVRLYVNGVLSRTSLKSGKFIKDMPDVNHV